MMEQHFQLVSKMVIYLKKSQVHLHIKLNLTFVSLVISCHIENKCHNNAQCVYNERIDRHVCLCRTGYKGDGITCRHERKSNNISVFAVPKIYFLISDSCVENATICSESAACVYDPILQDNVCSCRDGFVGDGIQ